MSVALVRKPHRLASHDGPSVRAWLRDQVHHEIRLKGQPAARLVLVSQAYVDTLDLAAVIRDNPKASLGKTWLALAARPGVLRTFAVCPISGEGPGGETHEAAVLVERVGDSWWAGTLGYRRDALTGLGTPGDWDEDHVDDLGALGEVLGDLIVAGPGPLVSVMEPRGAAADIRAAFGELPEGVPVPNTVQLLIELAAHVSVNELIDGVVKGAVVVRIAGRSWEKWALGDEIGMGLDEMIRHLANVREPKADGVALVQLAIRPGDEPPAPGVQIVAERAGMVGEAWIPLVFPAGGGRPALTTIHWQPPAPVTVAGLWIGVSPSTSFDLGPLGADA